MNVMTNAGSDSAAEPQLLLRRDLRSALHENRGDRYFLIEDPARDAFFRLGPTEWHFASKLDGRTSVRSAYQSVCEELGEHAISPEKAQNVCQWLTRSGLIKSDVTAGNQPPQTPEVRGPALLMSAFFFRIPLCHPDKWLERFVPYMRGVFSLPALCVWLVLVALGFQQVFQHWDRFRASTTAYLSPVTWIYLAIVWLVLKIAHELFHALACKHFGGRVGSSGIALILFAPVAFVDVTSAWTFRSKWHRIWTSAAGMYIEFAIAAVAAMVWARSDSPLVQTICHSVVMAASVTTVLFNGNPLMRFDGYYILTDLLEIQNLYGMGREHVRSVMRSVFFGLPRSGKNAPGWSAVVIRAYGWCSSFWRILVCLSMMLGASTLFHGAGILLAAAAAIAWFAKPLFGLVRYLMIPQLDNQPSRSRFMTVTGSILAASAILAILPFPGGVAAPAIVDYEPLHYVRAEASGFVQRVQVEDGDEVVADAVLMTIRNDELSTQLLQVRAELKQSEVRSRILHREHDVSAYQAEQEKIVALTEKVKNLDSQVQGLTIRSPESGKVLTRRLFALEGQYVELGETLITIGSHDAKAVLTLIPEEYVETFESRVGADPHVWVKGHGRPIRNSRLVRVEPSASDTLRHAALGGNAGGPIPVRVAQSEQNEGRSDSRFRMIAPRFYGVVELDANESARLEAGQLAEVRFTDWSETVGKKVHRVITTWIQSKLGARASS